MPFQVAGLEVVDAGEWETQEVERMVERSPLRGRACSRGPERDCSGIVGNYRGDAVELCGDGGPEQCLRRELELRGIRGLNQEGVMIE